jgi:hypothetical protein
MGWALELTWKEAGRISLPSLFIILNFNIPQSSGHVIHSRKDESMGKCLFNVGEEVSIKSSKEPVTILRAQYVKNMKRYSYIVKEHPSTFFFEEELEKR